MKTKKCFKNFNDVKVILNKKKKKKTTNNVCKKIQSEHSLQKINTNAL